MGYDTVDLKNLRLSEVGQSIYIKLHMAVE